MRISSVAVRPRMSFARAVSCTPGSCTTTRSAPCCWMIGSATPSSLTRLRRIVMFCWTRAVLDALLRLGLQARDEPQFAAAGVLLAQRRGRGTRSRSRCARACARPSSLKRSTTFEPSRADARVDAPSSRASASGCRSCSGRRPCRARPSCRPAAGSARRRAGRGRGTSAARRSTPASAATTTAGSARRCSCRRASAAARPSPSAACRCRRSGP